MPWACTLFSQAALLWVIPAAALTPARLPEASRNGLLHRYNQSWVAHETAVHRDFPVAELLSRDATPHVALLGMMASGTNLLLSLMKSNLDARVLDRLDSGFALFWKHAPLDQILPGRPGNRENFRRVTAVAIVRNPLSLLTHYVGWSEKHMCGLWWERISETMLNDHCGPVEITAATWDGGARYHLEAANVAELWNAYARSYLRQLPQLGFNKTLLIRFEDLLEDPTATLGRVSSLLGLAKPAEVVLPTSPQGPMAHSSRGLALRELRGQSYLSSYNARALAVVCAHLDIGLMQELRYTDCDNVKQFTEPRGPKSWRTLLAMFFTVVVFSLAGAAVVAERRKL